MAEVTVKKRRQPFCRRVHLPVAAALGIWVLLNFLTSHLEWFGTGHTYLIAANILYTMLGITILFSSVFLYSVMYVRGTSLWKRILWSCIIPFVYILKEIWRVSKYFSPGESLYYALAPTTVGLLVGQLGLLCLCEIYWRWRDKKRGVPLRIFTSGTAAALAAFVILIYVMFFWGSYGDTPGSKWFYVYMEGYKAIFVH